VTEPLSQIDAINEYIVGRLRQIKMPVVLTDPPPDPLPDPEPIMVYPPDPQRDLGEMQLPCLAVSLIDVRPDVEISKPGHEVFIPSTETVTTTLDEHFGKQLFASIVSSKQEPYQIAEGADQLRFRVGKANEWQPDQVVTLMQGVRDAWEISRSINLLTRGVEARPTRTALPANFEEGDFRLRLETIESGLDIEILETEDSAHEALGLSLGVSSHLTRTGPASWTVRPYPSPFELYYQVDLRTADEGQARVLPAFVMEALPERFRPKINSQFPVFTADKPQNLDELAKPEYWTAFRWRVSHVWLDRLTGYTVKPIQDFRTELGA
jgi:hypothetical protein